MNNFNYQFPPNAQGQQASPFSQFQQLQQMFPQPQGSVYSIQSPADIGNVPIGSTGLSVALCLPEQVMYIKSFQSGSPVIMAYRVVPFAKEDRPIEPVEEKENSLENRMKMLEEKLDKLISSQGGKFDELL